MDQEEAKKKVAQLVERYEQVLKAGKVKEYSEEETKKEFILPLFKALGWDVDSKDEVSAEEHVKSSGLADYGFYINGRAKFYLEAKAFKADLYKEEFARQAIRYSFNKVVTWAVLTDFQNLKIFNANAISNHLGDKQYFDIPYTDYLKRFDQLWLLSREAFEQDLLDVEATKAGKMLQKVSVTDKLYEDLNKCRELLTRSLSQWNPKVPRDLLDEGVQKLLDRLIFIRVAEDRNVEPQMLKALIRTWKNRKTKDLDLYQSMIEKFRELDEIYDSNLFSKHPFEKWEEYSEATEKVINILYGKEGYYDYDFKYIPADVLGNIYENYLGYQLLKSEKGLTTSKDAKKRKEQGIYYTPTYIVDYIVTNALKPVLDKCESVAELKQIRVLDPACGSGSFLLKAMEVIADKYKEFGYKGDELTKVMILTDNIYGVDLDEKAVEIAQLNLLINSLDTRMKLPNLAKNIKNGNSLISGTDQELEKAFGKNYRDKKPFNWEEEFPEVFNRKNPGFDVIIGNPPWVSFGLRGSGKLTDGESAYYRKVFPKSAEYKISVYSLFMEQGLRLTNSNGFFSFIVPDSFLLGQYFQKIRSYFLEDERLLGLILLKYKVFMQGVAGACVIFTLGNKGQRVVDTAIVDDANKFTSKSFNSFKIDIDYYKNLELKRFRLFKDKKNFELIKKIDKQALPLREIASIHTGIRSKIGQQNVVSITAANDKWKPGLISGSEISRYWVGKTSHYILIDKSKLWSGGFDDKIIRQPKILIRQTGDRIFAAIDKNEYFHLNNIHSLVLKNTQYSLETVIGILNSSLMTYYYLTTSLEEDRAMAQTDIESLEKLPIYQPDLVSAKPLKELDNLVVKIMKLKQEIRDSLEGSNEWHLLKSEIEKTDHQINQLVYKLYNLTPEEISLIEGDTHA